MPKALTDYKSINVKLVHKHLQSMPAFSTRLSNPVVDAVAFYRAYFNVPINCDYYKSYARFSSVGFVQDFTKGFTRCSTFAVLADGTRKIMDKVLPEDQIVNSITPKLSDLYLYKHFLSATSTINPELSFWLHLAAGTTSEFLVIDRDYRAFQNDNRAYVDKVRADYFTMVGLLGKPSLVVTSRGIESGLHFFYKLDSAYPLDIIQAFALSKLDSLNINAGNWEIFPKHGTSIPCLPFGMNSRAVIDGVVQPELGLFALDKWYSSRTDLSVLSLAGITMAEPLSTDKLDLPKQKAFKASSNFGKMTLPEIKDKIADLFQNPNSYKRQNAQWLLKYHTQIFEDMGLAESIDFAWSWLRNHIHSTDINERPEWAYQNLVAFFSKQLNSSVLKSVKYQLEVNQVRAILSELIHKHSEICNLVKVSSERQNGEILAVYSLYLFLHAERQRQKVKTDLFQVKTSKMAEWPGCTDSRYRQALDVLIGVGLMEIKSGLCITDDEGNIRRDCNSIIIKSKLPVSNGKIVDLDKTTLPNILLSNLPSMICQDLYGSKGYASRLSDLKAQIHINA